MFIEGQTTHTLKEWVESEGENKTITERQKDRKTERQKDRKTERQKDRKTERQKDRKTERQKDTITEGQRDRKTDEPLSTLQTRSSSKSPEAEGQRGLHRRQGLHQSQLQREQITPLVSLQFT